MIRKLTTSYLEDFISLFYPQLCIGCDNLLPKDTECLCPKCHYNLPKTRTHELEVAQFREKFQGIVPVAHIFVYLHFHKKGLVQRILHELKYGNQPQVGEMLGKRYGRELSSAGYSKSFDFIVPVPIHNQRLKERGYNQSESFGNGLSSMLSVPLNQTNLVKVRHTSSQIRKSKLNRIKSVERVFEVRERESFKGKRLLLVDDLLTTGSTLIACVEVLLECSPKSVSIATIGGAK